MTEEGPVIAETGASDPGRRLVRLVAGPFVVAPVACLAGAAGTLLVASLSASPIDKGPALLRIFIIAAAATVFAVVTSVIELATARRGVRLAAAAALALMTFLVGGLAFGRDAGYVAAIVGSAVLSLLALRGLASWPLVAAVAGHATTVTSLLSIAHDGGLHPRNAGVIVGFGLASATAAATLALIDHLAARRAGDAPATRPGGRVGAAALVLSVSAIVAAGLKTEGWARAPIDVTDPRLEVVAAGAAREPDGRVRVRVRVGVNDHARCDVRVELGSERAAATWSPGDGPLDLVVAWPEGETSATYVSVHASDEAGNLAYEGRKVAPPP